MRIERCIGCRCICSIVIHKHVKSVKFMHASCLNARVKERTRNLFEIFPAAIFIRSCHMQNHIESSQHISSLSSIEDDEGMRSKEKEKSKVQKL